ncbi:MAG TPA: cofactor-independent phosphoglycerate mutase [Pirellulaceae bacterium]|nr:cofactor-independent phosphoglycerate mutase [Pirellulaceae bacterium]
MRVVPPTVAMKYVIVIPDGCADEPQESLGGKTPLQAAHTPWMDEIARRGVVGRASHVPPGYAPGSDVANLSLLGYDPEICFTGRAPLEAAAQGIELGPEDWAVRCNLVTVQDQTMKSFTADHISTDEATYLLKTAQERLGEKRPELEFVPGVSYRNLLLYRGKSAKAPFSRETRTTPPHDLTDQTVADDFPRGPGSDLLVELMNASATVFAEHPVNVGRQKGGKLPATNVWLWGLGRAPSLSPFDQLYGKTGAMITAVDLLRGLAALLGWRRIEAPGATGYLDTDYASKGRTAIAALEEVDIVCVHIEAPDEASHEGRVDAKIDALEKIDAQIVGPLFEKLQTIGDYRILVSPDHPTPCRTKTHSRGFVPFTICGAGIESQGMGSYSEVSAEASSLNYPEGWKLMSYFLGTETPKFG